MKNNKAYLAALSYSLIIGLSFLSTKVAITYGSPLLILAHRFSISFVGIYFILKLKKVRSTFRKEDLIKIAPMTLFYPILFFGFQAYGLSYISSAESGILFAVLPVITLLLASFFIQEKPSMTQKIGIFLSVSGVVFIFTMKGVRLQSDNIFGIVLTSLSVLSMSIYSIIAKQTFKKYNYLEVTYLMILIGAVSFNILYIGSALGTFSLSAYLEPFTHSKYIMSIVYIGFFASVLSSVFSNYALSILPASQLSVFSNLSTLVSIIAGVVLLGERLYFYHGVGTLLILIGIFATNLGNTRKQSSQAQTNSIEQSS